MELVHDGVRLVELSPGFLLPRGGVYRTSITLKITHHVTWDEFPIPININRSVFSRQRGRVVYEEYQ